MDVEKLEILLEEYHKKAKEVAEKVLAQLKKESANYGELQSNLTKFKKSILYDHINRQRYESIFPKIEKTLEEEMNGLPLTNRSGE